ncbi:MAG: c-type cytochrome [Acidobacteria bacterium]|nr:c-type cytochrome [Acidobacteriota bacterium]
MKIIRYALLGLAALAAAGFAYLTLKSPKSAPPSDIRIAATPARLERGRYIFENLADCAGCHSERDWTKAGGPVIAGRTGVGVAFPKEMGLPGDIVAPNITPDPTTGIGTWTDGEKIRAIREGISKDGRALFPFMPYTGYRRMSDEDVQSLVVYLNALPPVKNAVARTKLNFPVNLLIKDAPQPVAGPVQAPASSNAVQHGEYLAYLGGCLECHTQQEKGAPKEGMLLAGGFEFRVGQFTVLSANITPEVETGLGAWSEQRFLDKFRGQAATLGDSAPRATQANFTLMPWTNLAQLTDQDLKALYAFLRTVKPVKNAVEPHKPLTQP